MKDKIILLAIIAIILIIGTIGFMIRDSRIEEADKKHQVDTGQGKNPKLSPINIAEKKDIKAYRTNNNIDIDGLIDNNEWKEADTIWFMLGDSVNTTAYFLHNDSHLIIAYHIPDNTPENREKMKFYIDSNNDRGGIDKLKQDDILIYLQRGDEKNLNPHNPNINYSNHAWETYIGYGNEWVYQNRTMPFIFNITNTADYWDIEIAIPTEYINYNGENIKEYASMSFVANAGYGQGSWPINSYVIQPNSWGKLTLYN